MIQLEGVHYLKIYQTLATLISIDIFPIDFVFLDQSIHYNVDLQEEWAFFLKKKKSLRYTSIVS